MDREQTALSAVPVHSKSRPRTWTIAVMASMLLFAAILKFETLLGGVDGQSGRPSLLVVGTAAEIIGIVMLLLPSSRRWAVWLLVFGCWAFAALHLLLPDFDCGCLGRLSKKAFSEVVFLALLGLVALFEAVTAGSVVCEKAVEATRAR